MQTAAEERNELRTRLASAVKEHFNNLWYDFDIGRDDMFPDRDEWDAIRARVRDLCEQAYLRNHSIGADQ